MDHPEIIRASRTMKLCGSCSSYQGHVQRIPALSLTESLRIRRYSNIAVPKPLEISNYCWVINTADCLSSWTLWTIKTHFSFKLFFFVPESKPYTYLIAFTKKINLKNRFRRFHGLLIHSLVTPWIWENPHKILETNPSRFKLCRSFNWAVRFDTWLIRLTKYRIVAS